MSIPKGIVKTPLMEQYFEIKSKYPDTILLFRVGDFYETFADDAIAASEILDIVLTHRANGCCQTVKLAGFPYHALDTYLPKLVRAGKRIAICDQLEDPKTTKRIVKRGVTELITPGVSINDSILSHKENNFLAAVHFDKNICGTAFLDISTGEFLTTEGSSSYIDKLFNHFSPKEVLLERNKREIFKKNFGEKLLTFEMEDWVFTEDTAECRLHKQFETKNLKGFGIQHLPNGIIAAGAILHYLDLTQHAYTNHIFTLTRIEEEQYVRLDKFTIHSLELLNVMNEGGGQSLLKVLDKTVTSVGARMLRKWIVFPLKKIEQIEGRLSIVEYFLKSSTVKDLLEKQLNQISDLERLISKVSVGKANPYEVAQIKIALDAIIPIKEICLDCSIGSLKQIGEQLNLCSEIREKIQRELSADPPVLLSKGNVIAEGINGELDELRQIVYSGKDHLLKIQQREIFQTGIPSLKVGYNNVFGYYIEVRHSYKKKIPSNWIRKQTLVHAERYITEELKIYEEKILGAEDRIIEMETDIFNSLVSKLSKYIIPIQINARLIAEIDCLLSFAKIAEQNHYVRPQIDASRIIDIKKGRHPVIETQLQPDELYVPNDIYLDNDKQQIIIITGPNMAGKSALLRQTALITLMAQIGSFVPADSARIGWVDKIFARVGASDNISLGESTFMVEMSEAADILNNLSDRSLIIFDELGRGTSTYDGISIAWAIVEYIHEHPTSHPKTLFSTHYHELNEMEKYFERIKNYNISVKEIDNKVIFLRKLARGGSKHSFGIHVAKMAGIPKNVVQRGHEILFQLETNNQKKRIVPSTKQLLEDHNSYQLSFFQLDDPVLSQIRNDIVQLDINNLTPIEALNKLNDIKRVIKGDNKASGIFIEN
ncbi:MAG: DNA mismatch repair protein MutS [Candidatus Azobacteroides pseudotrichonymphae]|jgi:DNA mismatch repair protein MutS|nr:MAG: DNA mismatch repair protein MutS [Candidatus Azobacteroides pseudotrichonymphae]